MAKVIHTINNSQYLYEHHREGDKVVCDYIGPIGPGGGIRKAKHGGGTSNRVTQQTFESTDKGTTINKVRDNSRLGDKTPQEKSTMGKQQTRTFKQVSAEYRAADQNVDRLSQKNEAYHYKHHKYDSEMMGELEAARGNLRALGDEKNTAAKRERKESSEKYTAMMTKSKKFHSELDRY